MPYNLFSPWPSITPRGETQNGLVVDLNPLCRTCSRHECKRFHPRASPELAVLSCPKRLNCFAQRLGDRSIVLIGLADATVPKRRKLFRHNKQHVVSPEAVRRWIDGTISAVARAKLMMTEEAQRSIRGLHNIQPAVNIIVRAAEKAINEGSGRSFEERIAVAPATVRDVYYAADLLTWMMDIQHVLVRPESIYHGQRTPRSVYEMVDRFVRSFRVLAGAKHKRISLHGSSFMRPRCYESIATLFFILIHNAVKYSLENQEVSVRVNDIGNCIEVAVESYGPVVAPDEEGEIFTAGFRGVHAQRWSSEGSGQGLYVAKLIAERHHTKIGYLPPSRIIEVDGIPCGTTTFFVRLYP